MTSMSKFIVTFILIKKYEMNLLVNKTLPSTLAYNTSIFFMLIVF